MNDPTGGHSEETLLWNTFVTRMIGDPPSRSSPERGLYFVYWYMSEVNNGGHLQFFHNRGVDAVPETVEALRDLGCRGLAVVVSEASEAWKSAERRATQTPEDYVKTALEGEFDAFDTAFYEQEPDLMKRLEAAALKISR